MKGSSSSLIDVHERPPLSLWLPLSFQHVLAMFSATILVPVLTGLSISTALFTAGSGTIIYILVTGAKVPAFMGSSFAFLPALISIGSRYGMPYALGGAFFAGLFYVVVAIIVRLSGTKWIERALPPVVIGPVIISIGLTLMPSAIDSAMRVEGEYSLSAFLTAVFTLAATIAAIIFLKGFLKTLAVLIGIAAGYLFSLLMGLILPSFKFIDFSLVAQASWFGVPTFTPPKFAFVPILTFIIVSLSTMCEHLGNTIVTSKVVGKEFLKKPGLHWTLAGNGLASAWAALCGGPSNTPYGENIGVMAITKIYSVWAIVGAAVISIILSFMQKFGAAMQTIPGPVLGGISMLLYGFIAANGLRTMAEAGIDYKSNRNLIIPSVILAIAIGGAMLQFNVGGSFEFSLGGVALASVAGIILNLILPASIDEGKA